MPYFTDFYYSECLILQIFVVLNALFCKFCALSRAYMRKKILRKKYQCVIINLKNVLTAWYVIL